MKTIFYNFIVLFFFLIFIFLILSFLNYKYSGNPVYDRLGIEIKHLKYFKKKNYSDIDKEYLNYFSKYKSKEYLKIYAKENKTNNLISFSGEDVNLVYFVDVNNCRENKPEDYVNTDIVLLGDSYLWGVSINKPFDIAGRLRNYNSDKKILNLGTPGSGPIEQLKILENITKNNQFKNLIWFFYEGNDYQESTISDDIDYRKNCLFDGGIKVNEDFELINTSSEKYSFFTRFKIFLSEFLRGLNSLIKLANNYENYYNLNDHDYDLTLRKAKKYLDAKNVNKRIVYYIPSYSYHSHKKNSKHPQIKKINLLKNKVKEIALKNNFEFIDGNIFMDKIDRRLHLYHYGYPTHFNSIGYKLVADQINENLKTK